MINSSSKQITIIVGTRPELIKLAPVYQQIITNSDFHQSTLFTGQHPDLVQPLFEFFNWKPDHVLQAMEPGQNLASLTSRLLQQVDEAIEALKPDLILVQGDTTSAMVGSLVAFYHKIPIAHVEAGLRTFQQYSPFPEEANRQIISRLASFHFVPTEGARQNLMQEGIASDIISITGNTVVDALQFTLDKLKCYSSSVLDDLKVLTLTQSPIVLVTGHRRENQGDGIKELTAALKELASYGYRIIFPVHPNPNVENIVNANLQHIEEVFLIDPVPYPEFVFLMQKAALIISDSGGVQEEAPSLQTPLLVTRECTERPEAVEGGFAKLVPLQKDALVNAALIELKKDPLPFATNPFGDGTAGKQIAAKLALFLNH
jgi:UDP-N-acetylglucosamine 2-epimerase (non-hydrolysing)